MDENDEALRWQQRRNRGLNDLAAVIEKIWGARCNRHDGNCFACQAWTLFDCMERLTDTDVLADYDAEKTALEQL